MFSSGKHKMPPQLTFFQILPSLFEATHNAYLFITFIYILFDYPSYGTT